MPMASNEVPNPQDVTVTADEPVADATAQPNTAGTTEIVVDPNAVVAVGIVVH